MDRAEVEKMQTKRETAKGAQDAKKSRETSLSAFEYVQIPLVKMRRRQRANGWSTAEDRSWPIEAEKAVTTTTVSLGAPNAVFEMLIVCRQRLRHA